MTKSTITAAIMAALVTFSATQSQAQSRNCGPREVVIERLAASYGEARQAIAMNSDNSVLEVYASSETGTWTITVTKAGGPTCIVAAGQHYQHLAEAVPNTDNGA